MAVQTMSRFGIHRHSWEYKNHWTGISIPSSIYELYAILVTVKKMRYTFRKRYTYTPWRMVEFLKELPKKPYKTLS